MFDHPLGKEMLPNTKSEPPESCGLQRKPVSSRWILLPGQTSRPLCSPSMVGPGLLPLLSACCPQSLSLLRCSPGSCYVPQVCRVTCGPGAGNWVFHWGPTSALVAKASSQLLSLPILRGQLGCRRGPA